MYMSLTMGYIKFCFIRVLVVLSICIYISCSWGNKAFAEDSNLFEYFDRVVEYSGYDKFRVNINVFKKGYEASELLKSIIPKSKLGYLFDDDVNNEEIKGVFLTLDNKLVVWISTPKNTEYDAVKNLTLIEATKLYNEMSKIEDNKTIIVFTQPPQ